MESLYKLKIEILSRIHKNKQAQEEKKRLERILKESKKSISQSAKNGGREVKLSFGHENDAKMVETHFKKLGFKVIYSHNKNAYLQHLVTVSW